MSVLIKIIMKRIQIIVSGNIPNAEFREYILKEAFNRDITGYVQNPGSGKVEIIAEGKEEELRAFISQINITSPPIYITECNITWQDTKGEFNEFEILKGELNEEVHERGEFTRIALQNESATLDLIRSSVMDSEYVRTRIERVRYLFRFETLSSYIAISEITFANKGNEYIGVIKYDLGEYKPFLKITDSNGECLEFAKAREAGKNGNSDYLINIYLPYNRELKPKYRRTLTFENFSPYSCNDESQKYENANYLRFHFEMPDEINSYVVIEAAEHFDFDDYLEVIDQDGEVIEDNVMSLAEEIRFVSSRSGKRAYFSFKGDGSKRILRITHRHDVHKRLLNWIRVGLVLGVLSAVFIPIGLIYSFGNGFLNNSGLFITYPVFVITTLVIIKGWLFLKDLDSELENLNFYYILLVTILVLELIGIFMFSVLLQGMCPLFGNCN
ncbi:acylphosphatase [Methanoplanus endosymbiosus]|uniref:acylphosphatase n=1 Tax=Methanoplanus endosymbiosus TaxID=33865 RepID=A0A9E7PLF9_9EURY|nr:acylphosphatase [Methanoplanus endosymbiosus]UUX92298.1 acylphosphatase [Methanoplanus endosymbiosus]